jgi:hypothetical protein
VIFKEALGVASFSVFFVFLVYIEYHTFFINI